MCAVALGLNKRHGWLESPRCEPSRCPLTAVTMLDACIAGVWGNDLAGRTHWVSPALLETVPITSSNAPQGRRQIGGGHPVLRLS